MTPAKQLFTNADDVRPVGDCWRTCVAMLLDLPPAYVPHWVDEFLNAPDVQTDIWPLFEGAVVEVPAYVAACQGWLNGRGLELVSYDGPPPGHTGFAIATGPSPRGDWSHAVVVYSVALDAGGTDWRLAADPHPSNDYLAGAPTEFAIIREATS